jgi:hypothetical protein
MFLGKERSLPTQVTTLHQKLVAKLLSRFTTSNVTIVTSETESSIVASYISGSFSNVEIDSTIVNKARASLSI